MFSDYQKHYSSDKSSEPTVSLTPNAVQIDWKTPSEFLCCPNENTNNPIASYARNLKIGEMFSQNQYSKSIITDFAISKDENALFITCMNNANEAIKPWLLAKVTHGHGLFYHKNLDSFFKKESAEKYFVLAQGLEWKGGDTFDDFC